MDEYDASEEERFVTFCQRQIHCFQQTEQTCLLLLCTVCFIATQPANLPEEHPSYYYIYHSRHYISRVIKRLEWKSKRLESSLKNQLNISDL